MKNALLLALLTTLVFSCQQKCSTVTNNSKDDTGVKDSLTVALASANEAGEVVGFSVNIVNQNGVLYNEGLGFRDAKQQLEYQTNTIQNIGSVAKTILGVALLKAQELGKLNIDDPINKYLPFAVANPKHPDIPITIRHLATHSSSILDQEENYLKAFILENDTINKAEEVAFSHFQQPAKRISLFDFLEACLSVEGEWYTTEMFSENEPGSIFEYTNFGADLCGLIIELASGMPYAAFTEKYIFEPLRMTNSGWTIASVDAHQRSAFYLFKGQKIADYTAITYPNGGLFTSSEDLGKFLTELIRGYSGNGTLLSESSYQEFYRKQYDQMLNESRRINVGIFNEYNNDFIGSAELLIGHNGSDFGSFALMYFNPETKLGTIVMSNTDIDYKDDVVVPVIKDIWQVVLEHKDQLR